MLPNARFTFIVHRLKIASKYGTAMITTMNDFVSTVIFIYIYFKVYFFVHWYKKHWYSCTFVQLSNYICIQFVYCQLSAVFASFTFTFQFIFKRQENDGLVLVHLISCDFLQSFSLKYALMSICSQK